MNYLDEEFVVGSDFGAPASAGEQAKKIILIEGRRLGERSYSVDSDGRNERLVRTNGGGKDWKDHRRGWTIPDLAESLAADASVTVAAFDFPFSIPFKLLCDPEFARLVGAEAFGGRFAWAGYVARNLQLSFTSNRASARLEDLARFACWRNQRFWEKRSTDKVTNGSAPLKDKYQNVFAMTLAGVAMLEALRKGGVVLALSSAAMPPKGRVAFETYPAAVARHCGFAGRYKRDPATSMDKAEAYLAARGISLSVAEPVRRFCLEYTTGSKNVPDPDGADAFLCLVAAICFREGSVDLCVDDRTTPSILNEEGCVIAPKRAKLLRQQYMPATLPYVGLPSSVLTHAL